MGLIFRSNAWGVPRWSRDARRERIDSRRTPTSVGKTELRCRQECRCADDLGWQSSALRAQIALSIQDYRQDAKSKTLMATMRSRFWPEIAILSALFWTLT